MKKFFLFATVACMAMTACEDVPAPYEIFDQFEGGEGGEGTKTSLPYTNANLKDWEVVTPQGVAWSLGNTYAKASGYANNNTTATESWLISPALDLTTSEGAAHIAFEHVIRYVNAQTAPLTNHTMWIATDYAGDVTSASWTKLDYHPVESATQTWDFYDADEIAIPADFINKTVYVAFKFVCGASSTTWELKNFKLLSGEAAVPSDKPVTPDVPATGAGSKNEPYNVGSAQSATGNAWVEGFIVGYIDGQVYATGATFAVPAAAETEVLLADAADVKDPALCIPVQLPAGDIRSGLELFANPSLLGQKVKLYGSLEKYFGVTGLKSTSCAIVGDKVIGKDPESTEPDQPVGDVKGTGTAADPYNVAGVLFYTKALQADVNSTSEIYFKGIVSSVKEISPVGNYNNATFYISDDGKAANEFYIFRCLGLNKADIQSADLVKVGDEVLICGKVVNYKGNTPETVQKEAWIVTINGQGGNTPVDPVDPDPVDPTPDTPADPNQLVKNGDFELWTNGLPNNWKTASSAGNAKLAQSTDAHGGQYSVQVNGTTANQRLGYEETVYAPGTYTVKFYAKALGGATSEYGPQCRPGYVPVSDGAVGTYVYGNYATLSETEWTEVTYTFTLAEQTTLCLVVMNAKNSGNILIDDYSITKQ